MWYAQRNNRTSVIFKDSLKRHMWLFWPWASSISGYTQKIEIAACWFSPYSGVTDSATTRFLVWGDIVQCNFNRVCILVRVERFKKPFGHCDEIGVKIWQLTSNYWSSQCCFMATTIHHDRNANNPKTKIFNPIFKLGAHSCTTTLEVSFNKFQ